MVKNSLDMSWPIVTKHKRSKVWKDKICTMVEHVMGMYMESDRPNIITDSLQLIDDTPIGLGMTITSCFMMEGLGTLGTSP